MKQIYQATMQALLDAAADAGGLTGFDRPPTTVSRMLATRLGSIALRVAATGSAGLWADFTVRYSAHEQDILLLMGRILVRGRGAEAARIARILWGDRLAVARIGELISAVDAELPGYFDREREQEHHRSGTSNPGFPPARGPAYAHSEPSFLAEPWHREA